MSSQMHIQARKGYVGLGGLSKFKRKEEKGGGEVPLGGGFLRRPLKRGGRHWSFIMDGEFSPPEQTMLSSKGNTPAKESLFEREAPLSREQSP